jgi:hypothetical protein
MFLMAFFFCFLALFYVRVRQRDGDYYLLWTVFFCFFFWFE